MDGMVAFRKPLRRTALLLCALFLTSACSRSIRVPEEAATQENQAPFQAPGVTQSSRSSMPYGAPLPENALPFDDSHTLPIGTLLTVRLSDPVSAGGQQSDNSFEAVVDQAVTVGENTVLPRGAGVTGRVESARTSELKPDRGYLRLSLAFLHVGAVDVPLQTASLFARQDSGAASLSTVRLEKGRRLTFRLTEPVSLHPQRTQASR